MWAVRITVGAPHTYWGANVTHRQTAPQNTKTACSPPTWLYCDTVTSTAAIFQVFSTSANLSLAQVQQAVSLWIFQVLILTKASCLAHKGRRSPRQTTVWAHQLTNNQYDDEMHYVQVQITKKGKGLV